MRSTYNKSNYHAKEWDFLKKFISYFNLTERNKIHVVLLKQRFKRKVFENSTNVSQHLTDVDFILLDDTK